MKDSLIGLCVIFALLKPVNADAAHESNEASLEANESYLSGYVHSLFQYNYRLPTSAVRVKNNKIYLNKSLLNHHNVGEIKNKLSKALGQFKNVEIIIYEDNEDDKSKPSKQEKGDSRSITDGVMPGQNLFEPLIADPKWPRFTLAYQFQPKKGKPQKHFFAPNFGATIPLFRYTDGIDWEVGVQGGLFALMDIGITPTALTNADYFIGLPISFRRDSLSGLIRPYHLSSHLGDEFMLTKDGKRVKRINLSYEGVDLLLSYNFNWLRVYGGGGYIVNKEPSYYKRGKIQFGSEYYADHTVWDGRLRPVAGIDFKFQEHNKWYPGISAKAGVQLENSALVSHKMQLMLEYYNGKSFHGQFYKQNLRYLGVALNVFL